MTREEAKGFIQGKLDCMERCDVFDCKETDECVNCNYCYSQGNFGEQKKAFEMAIESLGNDTNVGSKWIPCEVDLPKKKDKKSKYGRGEYNGTVVNEKGHVFTTSVIFDYVNKKWVEEVIGWKVIAWQPLPEPYKEGDT